MFGNEIFFSHQKSKVAINSNMKCILETTLKLLFPMICLKCSYVKACVVTIVEKALLKHVEVG